MAAKAPQEKVGSMKAAPAPKAAPKAETKPEKKASPIGNRTFKDGQIVTLLVDYNPKRPGSAAHASFDKYEDGMSVSDFLKAGGLSISLKWDVDHGFIKIADEFDEDAEKKSKPAPKPKSEKPAGEKAATKKAKPAPAVVAEEEAENESEAE